VYSPATFITWNMDAEKVVGRGEAISAGLKHRLYRIFVAIRQGDSVAARGGQS